MQLNLPRGPQRLQYRGRELIHPGHMNLHREVFGLMCSSD